MKEMEWKEISMLQKNKEQRNEAICRQKQTVITKECVIDMVQKDIPCSRQSVIWTMNKKATFTTL